MYLIFDTETTGLPRDFNAPITDTDNWPRCIQIAWQLHDDMGQLVEAKDYLVKPDGFDIPYQSEKIHGISTDLALEQGESLAFVLAEFNKVLKQAKFVVGQNVKFDTNVMGCEFHRFEVENNLQELPILDTCTETTANLCQIPGGRGGKFKLPTLTELHEHLFDEPFGEAHNATADVEATTRCFLELIRLKVYTQDELAVEPSYFGDYLERNPLQIVPIGLKHLNLKAESDKIRKRKAQEEGGDEVVEIDENESRERLKKVRFAHLHNHTQFSVLQSTTAVADLIQAAVKNNMPAVALTDIGNMMAAFHFVLAGQKHNGGVDAKIKELEELLSSGMKEEKVVENDEEVTKSRPLEPEEILDLEDELEKVKQTKVLPIVGSEFFVCKDRKNKSVKDNGFRVPLIAKNKEGYRNLAKLSSAGHVEGYYYVPRVDKEKIVELKENVIAITGGLQGEIPQLILNVGEKQAEEAFIWWKEQFGEDFYVELNRHGLEEEELVNRTLLKFARKYKVKYFASNDTYYIDKDDAEAHDILLCIRDGERKSTPIGRGRGFRFGFENDDFYFKSQDEMKETFLDLPEAIETVQEIIDKCEPYGLASDVLLPAFDIPEELQDERDKEDPSLKIGENNYLRHITYEGAKERYGEITPEIAERLDFELEVIRKTGYPGYFLIVEDFIRAAREMGVSVGPGRGSAAGSAVAYCTKITNIDPIKYDLLFERFLNPERVSMPDIDIDFDDEGRGRVIQYVIDKYGASQVAQIITYGTMAAKSSIRDAGRVLDLPLPDTNRIAQLVPDMKLNKMFGMDEEKLAEKLSPEQMTMAEELKSLLSRKNLEGEVVRQAKTIEGSMRTTGIHACGVIITPSDIREHVPVALAKDSEMWSTQFDNSVVESAGLLKMDFLGLKTLTLIKDTLKIVKARHNVDIDIELIPIDDEETYALFQRGETVGVFQYESPGMQKYLKELKPTQFSDLIAMNALYRPGPLEYIPSFIRRKHGEEEIVYDIPIMEGYLKETYGITVYQEQVMLLSQLLADFTKGEADVLRKAMGKKQIAVLAKMKPKFINQAVKNGHPEDALNKIWTDWEAFASYAFNKSHSTCYAWIAYQTAYLKAHYPAEYMAAVLSNNMNDIKTVSFFMEECQRMGLSVLGPDVNESYYKFAVNAKGEVRFGMGGMKGVGEGPVKSMVEERKKEGPFTSIFDMVRRVSLKDCNKRVLESLAMGGGLDGFGGIHRAQYFEKDEKDRTLIEKALKYGAAYQNGQNSAQVSMFDMMEGGDVDIPEPKILDCKEWTAFEKLSKEKEVVGIYITGHPLDDYKLEIDNFCDVNLNILSEHINELPNKEFSFGGMAVDAMNLESRKGNKYGVLNMQDKDGSLDVRLFGELYLKNMHFLVPGNFLYIRGAVQLKRKAWNPDGKQKEFNVQYIELLENVRDKQLKKVYLRFDANSITSNTILELEELFTKYQGNKTVYIELIDFDELSGVSLLARQSKVNVTNDFLEELKAVDGFEAFSINRSMMNEQLNKLKQDKMKDAIACETPSVA
ncbi:MAG: DNA polymerase III subunit alpha [Flavobacteriales bacterium]|jgi:DNA polymerase-3 subunit alpha|nr:DNA polymerase III subunit alpha [Flavobacteriales bacterium]